MLPKEEVLEYIDEIKKSIKNNNITIYHFTYKITAESNEYTIEPFGVLYRTPTGVNNLTLNVTFHDMRGIK